ncbi:hypothetical protein TI39_contig694g00008 [Zymoseptoria brevis]|uniref:Uncharacterized protein n=1 Tax=Zymoseptoria brevis TaxID=1047168 RepID=A0A0F4GFM5_9PEZI|nr:hypothetical protein TI39_contig694g00008 [Zymoseptoria brevis]
MAGADAETETLADTIDGKATEGVPKLPPVKDGKVMDVMVVKDVPEALGMFKVGALRDDPPTVNPTETAGDPDEEHSKSFTPSFPIPAATQLPQHWSIPRKLLTRVTGPSETLGTLRDALGRFGSPVLVGAGSAAVRVEIMPLTSLTTVVKMLPMLDPSVGIDKLGAGTVMLPEGNENEGTEGAPVVIALPMDDRIPLSGGMLPVGMLRDGNAADSVGRVKDDRLVGIVKDGKEPVGMLKDGSEPVGRVKDGTETVGRLKDGKSDPPGRLSDGSDVGTPSMTDETMPLSEAGMSPAGIVKDGNEPESTGRVKDG